MENQNVLKHKLDHLLPHMHYIVVGSSMIVAACVSILIHKISFQLLLSWSVVTWLIIICRYLISRLYYAPNRTVTLNSIYLVYITFSILTGSSWGVVSGIFLQHQDIQTVLMINFVIAIECAVAIVSLSASSLAISGFLVTTLIPAFISIANLPMTNAYQLALGMLILILMLTGVTRTLTHYLNLYARARKRAEKRAEDSEKIKRQLLLNLNSIPLAYIEFSTNFMITQWNQSATNTFGYIADDVIGHHIELFQPDKQLRQTSEESYIMLFTKAVNKKETITATNKRLDGSTIQCEWHCAKLLNEEGEHTGYAAYVEDVSKRLQQEEAVKQYLSLDALTGLPNKSLLFDRLKQAMSSAQRHGHLCGLLVIKIENLNQINDALGHQFGDVAIKELAQRFRDKIRQEETLARFVSDEFVLLVENLQNESSAAELSISVIAEKIINAASKPVTLHHKDFTFGATVGVTLFPNKENLTPMSIFKQALLALAEVKNTSEHFGFYDDILHQTTLKKVKLLSDIRSAIKEKQFELYVQPKLSIKENRIIGGEALARWHHPQNGMISPASFIPAIESSSYVFEFGEWVLKQSLSMIAKWRAEGLCDKNFRLAINISSRQLLDQRFANLVNDLLLQFKLPGNCIELEMTESTLVKNHQNISLTLQSLMSQGVEVAVDDFGSSHSSLSLLSHQPISTIKIDRNFVADIAHNHADTESIVNAIISIGRAFKLNIVAVGVENNAQLNYLKKSGCEHYQGFVFSPAVPESQFSRFLQSAVKAG